MVFDLGIADDEPAIRRGLVNGVDWARMGFRVVRSFEDGEDVLSYLDSGRLDVLLTDIRMSVISGLDVARHIHEQSIATEVVLLTGFKDFEYAREAIRYSVRNYLLKPTHADELHEVFCGVHRVLEEKLASGSLTLSAERNRHGAMHEVPQSPEERSGNQAMRLVQTYIRRNAGTQLSMAEVAREFYYSPTYFSRLFREKTGKTFMAYVTECRMALAESLLRESPELAVLEIAGRVGYSDPNYFAKVFRREMGYTPSDYRKMLRHDHHE